MKRKRLVLCSMSALLFAAFLPPMVQAEMPIEVRLISIPHDVIADSRTSLQPQARFAINRPSGDAANEAGPPFSEGSNVLPDGAMSVPVPPTAVARDSNNAITDLSFSVVSVASSRAPAEPEAPLYIVIAVPADHAGELSIQYTRHQGAGRDRPPIVTVSSAGGAPRPGVNQAAVRPPASLVHSEQ